MSNETDHLVFDYLSRVGDVAHQQQLSSGDRMRLVSSLRNEIEQRRSRGGDSPAAVKRLLGSLGEPEAVVRAASRGGGNANVSARAPEPQAPSAPAGQEGRLRKPGLPTQPSGTPSPSRNVPGPGAPTTGGGGGAAVLPGGGAPDWWRIEPGMTAGTGFGGGDTESMTVGGFVGGVEIPDLLKPPTPRTSLTKTGAAEGAKPTAEAAADDSDEETVAEEEAAAQGRGRRWWRVGGVGAAGMFSSPLLLLAAALLVAGAILGSLIPLALGWVLAYVSRSMTRAEAKIGVFGVPGAVVAGGIVWLWGRSSGRWGAPIPDGTMTHALGDTWPVVLRVAAIASALYLLWRARRRSA